LGNFTKRLPNTGWTDFVVGYLGITEAEVDQQQGVVTGGLADTCWRMLQKWRSSKYPHNTGRDLKEALESACRSGIDTQHAIDIIESGGEHRSGNLCKHLTVTCILNIKLKFLHFHQVMSLVWVTIHLKQFSQFLKLEILNLMRIYQITLNII